MENEFNIEEWYESSTAPDSVTIQDFDKYVDQYLDEKEIALGIEDQLTTQNKKVMAMQGKLMEYLDVMGKAKHITSRGSISKVETTSWKAPEGEERLGLVQFLKEKDQYDNVMAFNAKKFSSWYSAERESNPGFRFNGVEQATTKYIRFNKAKG